MARKRYIKQDQGSFYGEYLYKQLVPPNHFFRNLSERQTENYVNESIPAKYFVGMAIDKPAPDHSTLTYFKKRMTQKNNLAVFEEMLAEIVQMAMEKGIQFGSLQIVDSVHSIANVNTRKDDHRKKKEGKDARDPDAKWGVKHQRKVKSEEGKTIKQTEYFYGCRTVRYGYKAHVSLNAQTHMITSIVPSTGEAWDGKYLKPLVEKDLAQDLPVETVGADRGYDDHGLHYYLEQEKEIHPAPCGIHSGILLKDIRTKKKTRTKKCGLP